MAKPFPGSETSRAAKRSATPETPVLSRQPSAAASRDGRTKGQRRSEATGDELDRRTLVERIIDELVVGLIRGDHRPGDRLPTVRALARTYGVTVPTAQRIYEGLRTLGVIETRHGAGSRWRDPVATGELRLLPYWIRATLDRPQEAAALFAQGLELRRLLAVPMLLAIRPRFAEGVPRHYQDLVDQLATASDVATAFSVDMELTDALLVLYGNLPIRILFAHFRDLVRTTPFAAEAIYADPSLNAQGWRTVFAGLASEAPDAQVGAAIQRLMASADHLVVERFAELVVAAGTSEPPSPTPAIDEEVRP